MQNYVIFSGFDNFSGQEKSSLFKNPIVIRW